MAANLLKQKIHDNPNFFFQPELVNPLDECMAQPDFQQDLARSQRCREFLSYAEGRISYRYAKVIHYMLQRTFNHLTKEDLLHANYFTVAEITTSTQAAYLNSCQLVGRFVKFNVIMHNSQEAKLNAIKRWVDVAEKLLDMHCYEGFCQVSLALVGADINKLHLTSYLPKSYQQKIHKFEQLISPVNKHQAWRDYCRDKVQERSLPIMSVFVVEVMEAKEKISSYQAQKDYHSKVLVQQKIQDKAKVIGESIGRPLPTLNDDDEVLLAAVEKISIEKEKLLWARAKQSSLDLTIDEQYDQQPQLYQRINPGFFKKVRTSINEFGDKISSFYHRIF